MGANKLQKKTLHVNINLKSQTVYIFVEAKSESSYLPSLNWCLNSLAGMGEDSGHQEKEEI